MKRKQAALDGVPAAQLTPSRIVEELDKHVVGQADAKRAVSIAIRNRWRRMQLRGDMREEVLPKNILLIGSTGVGKTELARRIATLIGAPFTKVEATKYTEVGYVGRDVESIIRDLLESAMGIVRSRAKADVATKARERAEARVLDALVDAWTPGDPELDPFGASKDAPIGDGSAPPVHDMSAVRVRLRERLRSGALDGRDVEIDAQDASGQPLGNIFGDQSFAQTGIDLSKMLERMNPTRTRRRTLPVKEAVELLAAEEAEGLVDAEDVTEQAIRLVEDAGIVFLDEIDKVAGSARQGPDISREGVQRDLLPLIEGTTVSTRHGPVKTDHILFIAAGAFHVSKPADLLPELQGRLPIRVRLDDLTEADFVRILTEPQGALTKQQSALMETEGVDLRFAAEGIEEVARVAAHANRTHENIGARRLMTVMERVIEEISFEAPACRGARIVVDQAYVRARVGDLVEDDDLGRYVL